MSFTLSWYKGLCVRPFSFAFPQLTLQPHIPSTMTTFTTVNDIAGNEQFTFKDRDQKFKLCMEQLESDSAGENFFTAYVNNKWSTVKDQKRRVLPINRDPCQFVLIERHFCGYLVVPMSTADLLYLDA